MAVTQSAMNRSAGAVVLNQANHPLELVGNSFKLSDTFTVFGDEIIAEKAMKTCGDSDMRVSKCALMYDLLKD